MTTREAMVAAMLANPTDPLPRLVLADLLEEEGMEEGPLLRGAGALRVVSGRVEWLTVTSSGAFERILLADCSDPHTGCGCHYAVWNNSGWQCWICAALDAVWQGHSAKLSWSVLPAAL